MYRAFFRKYWALFLLNRKFVGGNIGFFGGNVRLVFKDIGLVCGRVSARPTHTATHCNTLHLTSSLCSTLQHTTTRCHTLQHAATRCNTLQPTATRYISLYYGLATISRLLKIIGLFCKKALLKRLYSAEETWIME